MPFSQSPHSVRSAQKPAGVPLHVAIIMDGNGRWAKARGLPRFEGHRSGVEAVRRAVKSAIQRGVRYLTVYSFSSENWRRPPDEVAMLMGLLKLFIRDDLADLDRNGVKVRVIGERDNLSPDIAALIAEAETLTKDNCSLTLTVAFNYGARQEIVKAAQRIALDVRDGRLDPSRIGAEEFADRLDTSGLPDPDLIIRTSGEMRLSNFLLWQCAYAELVFLPILWPDFDDAAFGSALDSYAERERRFGAVTTPAQALTAS
jgi:undecaprenyl diphosphate synthase